MPTPKSSIKPIHFLLNNADCAPLADHAPLRQHADRLATAINDVLRLRAGAAADASDAPGLLAIVRDFLTLMASVDNQYGTDAELPLRDAAAAVDEALRCLAELDAWFERMEKSEPRESVCAVQLGIGYWAMRHQLPIGAAEPIVNALAARANRAETRQESAAVYALTQGFVQHFAQNLSADLDRSHPERPWRLLNLNFAITAIRTGDATMMRFAFETLNSHLPDERAGFYEEALALASQPGFPLDTRALIEAERRRWTQIH